MAVNPAENNYKFGPYDYANSSSVSESSPVNNVNSVVNPNNKVVATDSSGVSVENAGDLDDETYESLIKDLNNKIEQKKQELGDAKKGRGWLSSIGNGILEVFGGGDKTKQNEINDLEKQLESLEQKPEEITSVYKSIMGQDLDLNVISSLREASTITKNITSEQNQQIQELLTQQYNEIEAEFKEAKDKNGWISGGWDKFKNWTGIGASSNKTQTELNNMKEELNSIKEHPENLAQAYKNITGRDLNSEELTKLANGELSLKDASKASESVQKYSDGQKMATDVVADVVSGIVAVGAIALAPFTGGASLLLAAGVGAVVKVGLKASDCIGNEKTYGLKDFAYDAVTGSINGAMAPISNGLGGAVGTGVAKTLGIEAVESTAKAAMAQTVKIAGKEVAEEAIEQTVKQTGKNFLTNVLAKQGTEYVLKEGTEATTKTFLAKTAAYGADMAVDGTLSGATDGFARAFGEGRIEDIPQDMLNGAVGGLIAAPVIGGGFRLAIKGGHGLSNKFDFSSSKTVSNLTSDKVLDEVENIAPNNTFGTLTGGLSKQEEITPQLNPAKSAVLEEAAVNATNVADKKVNIEEFIKKQKLTADQAEELEETITSLSKNKKYADRINEVLTYVGDDYKITGEGLASLVVNSDKYYDTHIAMLKQDLSPETITTALGEYTGSGTFSINGALLKGKQVPLEWASCMKTFDAMLESTSYASVSKEGQVFYRGLTNVDDKFISSITDVGSVYKNPGFSSTSIDENIAKKFAGDLGKNGNFVLEITMPEGAKYLNMNNLPGASTFISEKEMLLPRDSQFLIKSFDKETGIIKVELLPSNIQNNSVDNLLTSTLVKQDENNDLGLRQAVTSFSEETTSAATQKIMTNEEIQELIAKRTRPVEKLTMADISHLQSLGEKEWQHAQELLYITNRTIQFSVKEMESLSKLTDEQFIKAKDLFHIEGRKMQLLTKNIIEFSSLENEQWSRAKDLLFNNSSLKANEILNSVKNDSNVVKSLNEPDSNKVKTNANLSPTLRAKYKNSVSILEKSTNANGEKLLSTEQIDNYLQLLDSNPALRSINSSALNNSVYIRQYCEIIPSINKNNSSCVVEFLTGRTLNSLPVVKYFNDTLTTLSEPEASLFKKSFVELSRMKNPNGTLTFMPIKTQSRNDTVPVKKLLDLSINNPAEYAKYQEYMKLIPSGDIPSYIFTKASENGKISKLVTDDMDRLLQAKANGSDITEAFIPTFKTRGDAGRNTGVGDIYSLEGSGKVFITSKNNYGSKQQIELKVDRETYMKLFPPVKRYAIAQGNFGDCYLVSGISNLISNPNSRAQFYEAFEQKGDDLIVKIPNMGGKIWKNFNNISLEPNNKILKGSLGNQLYEQTYQAAYTSLIIKHFAKNTDLLSDPDGFTKLVEKIGSNPSFSGRLKNKDIKNMTDLSFALNEGGHQISILDKVLPSQQLDTPKVQNEYNMSSAFNSTEMYLDPDYEAITNVFAHDFMEEFSNNDFLKIASSRSLQIGRESALDPANSIYSGHAYSISNIDSEKELVTIINPWNTAEEITIDYETFFKNFRKFGAKRIEGKQ